MLQASSEWGIFVADFYSESRALRSRSDSAFEWRSEELFIKDLSW